MQLRQSKLGVTSVIVFYLGLSLHFTPCVGQVNPDSELFRDSLYRRISREMRAELSCRFAYAQGSSLISASLNENTSELHRLDNFIRHTLSHPHLSVERILLTGYSSIEGSYSYNEYLSRNRVEGFYNYLYQTYPEFQRYPYTIAWVAEDWDGLSKAVRHSSINEWEEILEIIRKNNSYDDREALLKYLNGGRAYRELERTILPGLRRLEISIEYTTTTPSDSIASRPDVFFPQTSAGNVQNDPKEQKNWDSKAIENWLGIEQGNKKTAADMGKAFTEPTGKEHIEVHQTLATINAGRNKTDIPHQRPLFALKTNLLLWTGVQHDFEYTTPVANVALEYYVNDIWSVEIGAMYSYWRYNSNRKFQGVSGYRLEPRYSYPVVSGGWMKGYLGLYGRMGDYDRRLTPNNLTPNSLTPALSKGEGEESYTGDYWDAGLSAGVTFQLIDGFGLEVGARAGYVHTNAIRYTKDGEYNWYHSRKTYNKFNVTDLNVSLIYRFR